VERRLDDIGKADMVPVVASAHPNRQVAPPMSFGNATFGGFIVGWASRLPSNDLRSQARRPRYIQKV
jgi:hypothetical protein